MNTYSNTPPKPGLIEESAARFESDLAKADTVRASSMTGLLGLRAKKVNSRTREVAMLAERMGDDNEEVIKLKAAVAADQRFVLELRAEADRANVARPGVDQRGWTVYGFVRDPDLQGQPGLTVALFDRANRWMEAIGYACTDSRGYFQLRYDPGAEKLQDIFIRVLDQKRQVLYRDKKPMRAVLGEVKYREIILNGECDSCQPPSDKPSKEVPIKTKSPAKTSKSRKAGSAKKIPKAQKSDGLK